MKKLSDKIKDLMNDFYDNLEIIKSKYVGLKPTEAMRKELQELCGVEKVVFYNHNDIGLYSDIDEFLDLTMEQDGVETDYVIGENWAIALSDDELTYSSDFDYIFLDIELVDSNEE